MKEEPRTGLVRYDAMCRAIAEAHEIDEVKDLRDKAMALERYAQQAMNMDAERKACEIRLRAERRIGGMLKELEKDILYRRKSEKRWVRNARAEFIPKIKANCFVCGKFKGVAEAHHIYPLSDQDESLTPNHDHEWLCPTHHVMIHRLLTRSEDSRMPMHILFADVSPPELHKLLSLVNRRLEATQESVQETIARLRNEASAKQKHADALEYELEEKLASNGFDALLPENQEQQEEDQPT